MVYMWQHGSENRGYAARRAQGGATVSWGGPAWLEGVPVVQNRRGRRPRAGSLRVDSLGRMAVFLLPSLKLKQKKKRGESYEDIVHDFLMKRFSGYTASAGNIFGYWRDDTTGRESYGEHKEYKVSFRGKNRVAILKEFLSELAGELDEDSIYLEYGEDAWLVYARKVPPARQ